MSTAGSLDMAADFEVSLVFGQRGVAKANGGDLVGALLLISVEIYKSLLSDSLVQVRPIDDWPGKTQYTFSGASAETVNREGQWVYLPADFFQKGSSHVE